MDRDNSDLTYYLTPNIRRVLPSAAALYELRLFQRGGMYGPLTERAMTLHIQTERLVEAANEAVAANSGLNPDLVNALGDLATQHRDYPHYALESELDSNG